MELSQQGQATVPANVAPRPLSTSSNQSPQVVNNQNSYSFPNAWGSEQFVSSGSFGEQNTIGSSNLTSVRAPYYAVPMRVQTGSAQPGIPVLTGFQQASLANRVSLRPQYFVNIPQSMPVSMGSQPSPSMNTKLQPAGPLLKHHVQKTSGTQSSGKRSLQKEQPVALRHNPQAFEPVRSKFRESLLAALSCDNSPQNKQQPSEKNMAVESKTEQGETSMQQDVLKSTLADMKEVPTNALSADEVQKANEDVRDLGNTNSNDVTVFEPNEQHLQKKMEEDQIVATDELLQGHGLCWVSDVNSVASGSVLEPDSKRLKTGHADGLKIEVGVRTEDTCKKAEALAFKIEAELFRLFGGVNKKYKERGRSLLFNLKDRSNPELRERVLSGDIAPDRLCNMSAEELASKELSEWRQAKAEELAQMVVLPDSEVDVRRLVKKTHKGDIQVEVEEPDTIAMEVSLGTNVLSTFSVKSKEEENIQSKENDQDNADGQIQSKVRDQDDSGSTSTAQAVVSGTSVLDETATSGNEDSMGNLELIVNEKTDLMQELMVDELKDTGDLPPIVTLDEFMLSLDTEPPFEELAVGASQDEQNSIEDDATMSDQEKNPASVAPAQAPAPEDGSQSSQEPPLNKESIPEPAPCSQGAEKDIASAVLTDNVDSKSTSISDQVNVDSSGGPPEASAADSTLTRNAVWEGAIQLTVGSVAHVAAVFKSGEKPSAIQWPDLIEVKGRVRNDALEKFLQELPLSRSRAIMVVDIIRKEESGSRNLAEASESYVASERVGFVEPCTGVEIYLCPLHPKMLDMLSQRLSKDHSESLDSTGKDLIGIVVWRRSHTSRSASHQRHSSLKRQHSSSGRQQAPNLNKAVALSDGPPPGFPKPLRGNDVTDDVPPGFGPGVVAREDDDLPEFDFVNASNNAVPSRAVRAPAAAHPVQQKIRELVQKYGQGSNTKGLGIEVEPWNDDDDDIPEWNPTAGKPQNAVQQQPVLLQQPVPQLHGFPQHQPYQASYLQPHLLPQQLPQWPAAAAVQPGWQQQQQQQLGNLLWPPAGAPTQPPPYTGRAPGFPNVGQSGHGWRGGGM